MRFKLNKASRHDGIWNWVYTQTSGLSPISLSDNITGDCKELLRVGKPDEELLKIWWLKQHMEAQMFYWLYCPLFDFLQGFNVPSQPKTTISASALDITTIAHLSFIWTWTIQSHLCWNKLVECKQSQWLTKTSEQENHWHRLPM